MVRIRRTLQWLVCVSIIALAPAGCTKAEPGAALYADNLVTVEEVVSDSFPTSSRPKVVVDTFNGPIDVTAGAGGTVKATVTKRASGKTREEAEEMLKKLKVSLSQQQDTVHITAPQPEAKHLMASLATKLEVPAGANLDVKTKFGDFAATGITGNITADLSNAAITIQGAKGELQLKTSFGKIDVAGPSVKVNVTNSNGPVTVMGAEGPLDLKTSFGAIDVDALCTSLTAVNSNGAIKVRTTNGPLTLTTTFGAIDIDAPSARVTASTSNAPITVRRATGPIDLTNSFGQVDVAAPATTVTVNNSNGAIAVKGAKGPLTLTSTFGSIQVDASGAEVQARTSNAPITIRGASGRVQARTSFGELDIAGQDAVVNAENSNGALLFAGSLAKGQHSLQSTFGPITLTLPAKASFGIDAQTSFGKITNQFALSETRTSNHARLVGTVGERPDVSVKLTTSHADVVIRQGK
jgi:DUF4097 and DUF4098 domain-containing protein YvlB